MGQQPLIAPPDRPGDRSTEIAAHTPGPWDFTGVYGGDREAVVFDADMSVVARITLTTKEAEANARLMAAAPDMLAALELAADYIKDLDGGDQRSETGWKSDELLDVWLKVRAAIAKATGG